MGKSRNAAIIIVVILLSGAAAMLAAEMVARFAFPSWAPRTGRVTKFWQYDETYGWAHKPGEQGRFDSFGFETTVRINSHGFRGPERTFERAPGARRAIVLGDSFVWGFGVEEEQTFLHLLEQSLPSGTEIINLGVSGYSTDQELLVYRNHGRKYRPDLVVLVVATNDVAMNVLPVAYLVYGKPVFRREGGQLVVTNQPVPQTPLLERTVVGLAAQSYVLNQLNRVREQWSVSNALARESLADVSADSDAADSEPVRTFPQTEAERLTVDLIVQTGREVEADGARFLVVLVDRIYAGGKFSAGLVARGLRVVSLDDAMAGQDTLLHLPDDLHWNPAGHQRVKAALQEPVAALLDSAAAGRAPSAAR